MLLRELIKQPLWMLGQIIPLQAKCHKVSTFFLIDFGFIPICTAREMYSSPMPKRQR